MSERKKSKKVKRKAVRKSRKVVRKSRRKNRRKSRKVVRKSRKYRISKSYNKDDIKFSIKQNIITVQTCLKNILTNLENVTDSELPEFQKTVGTLFANTQQMCSKYGR